MTGGQTGGPGEYNINHTVLLVVRFAILLAEV